VSIYGIWEWIWVFLGAKNASEGVIYLFWVPPIRHVFHTCTPFTCIACWKLKGLACLVYSVDHLRFTLLISHSQAHCCFFRLCTVLYCGILLKLGNRSETFLKTIIFLNIVHNHDNQTLPDEIWTTFLQMFSRPDISFEIRCTDGEGCLLLFTTVAYLTCHCMYHSTCSINLDMLQHVQCRAPNTRNQSCQCQHSPLATTWQLLSVRYIFAMTSSIFSNRLDVTSNNTTTMWLSALQSMWHVHVRFKKRISMYLTHFVCSQLHQWHK
jgi:hypothetical protein